MKHRPLRLRAAGGPHRAAAGNPRDAARLLVVRPGGRAGRPDRRRSAGPAAAGRCPGGQRQQGDRGAAQGPPHRARDTSRRSKRRCTSGSTARIGAPLSSAPRKSQVGDTLRFGDEGKVCFLGELDAQVLQKDEGGEVTLSFSFHGPVLDQAIAERGDMPLPPYIASRRRARRPGPRRLSDLFRADGGLGGGADGRAAFHRRAAGAAARSAASTCKGDAACRRRHVPAGQGGRHRGPRHARRVWLGAGRGRGRAQCGARQRRAHRRGRLDRAAAAGKRRRRATARSRPFPAKPRFSSRPATASAPST